MKRLLFVVGLMLGLLVGASALAEDKDAAKAFKKYSAEAKKALKANDWPKARDFFQSAAAEAEKFGPEDARLLETLRSQVEVNVQLRDYAEADPLCRRVLEIHEKKSGTNSLEVATDLQQLAEVCGVTGKYEEADIFLQRAQKILEWKHGAYDPLVGLCLAQRAGIYMMAEQLEEAEATYKKAFKLMDAPRTELNFSINQVVGESRVVLKPEYKARMMVNLGTVHAKQKKFAEAETDYIQAIKILEEQYSKTSTALVDPLRNLGLAYLEQNKLAEAEAAVSRAWGIVKKSVKPGHPVVKETRELLDEILRKEGKGAKAKADH